MLLFAPVPAGKVWLAGLWIHPWGGNAEGPNPQAKEVAMPDDYVSCDDLLDAFPLEDEAGEPEPEYGDFWGELDDDRDACD